MQVALWYTYTQAFKVMTYGTPFEAHVYTIKLQEAFGYPDAVISHVSVAVDSSLLC